MNKKIFTAVFALGLISFACKKNVPGKTDSEYSFDATLPIPAIAVADSAIFELAENPDVISFYSGETGNNYDNRNRTVLTGGSLKMKFETRVKNKPADTLDVLISTDFSGVYDSMSVANATWKNMNNKFLFPTPLTSLGIFVPSGNGATYLTDITDSVIAGQPFYLAFSYAVNKRNNVEWSVGKLGMYNYFTDGTATANVIDSTNINSGSFAPVSFTEPFSRWSKSSTLLKYNNSSSAVLGARHWYISRPLNPDAVAPDVPVVIKNISQSPLTFFKYKYKKPGTYKAVFVASYNRLNFEKTFVKEFTVVVQ